MKSIENSERSRQASGKKDLQQNGVPLWDYSRTVFRVEFISDCQLVEKQGDYRVIGKN